MAGWVATRSAIGSLGTRTQAVVSLIALRLKQPAPVYISKAYCNSPGAGDGSNSSLNAEYAVIRNGASSTPSLGGPCGDAAGHRYRFGTLRLRAGWQARMVSARKIACHESEPNVTMQ
jgi:hypothetical protein